MIYLLVYSFCNIHIYRYDSCFSFRKIIVGCLENVLLPQAIDLTAAQEDPGKKLKYVQTTQLTRYMCVWPVSSARLKTWRQRCHFGLSKKDIQENSGNEDGTICKYCVLQVNIFIQKSTNMENRCMHYGPKNLWIQLDSDYRTVRGGSEFGWLYDEDSIDFVFGGFASESRLGVDQDLCLLFSLLKGMCWCICNDHDRYVHTHSYVLQLLHKYMYVLS